MDPKSPYTWVSTEQSVEIAGLKSLIQFNNVLMLNRPRKFSAPPASINLQNQAKPDKNNNMIVNKKLEKKFDNSEDMDIHLSPQRPKSSMGDNKKNQIFTKDMKHSFAKPIKLTHNNSNLQRSVSSMSAEVVIDEKKAVNRSKITEKQITDSKKVKTTKRRASIANPRSGLVLKRDSIAPGRRSLAPRMSLGPQNQTSNALRPQTKVKDQGPRAVHKAAAQAIYIDLINEEKENILQCDIRHKHKKKYDRITVAVRKRPMNDNEKKIDGIDIVSILDDERISVHEPKEKVDMTRYIDNSNFRFDYVFGPEISNDSIYKYYFKIWSYNYYQTLSISYFV
ncbi:MAG: Kinesin-like protein kif2a [Marteilia pararefringens]